MFRFWNDRCGKLNCEHRTHGKEHIPLQGAWTLRLPILMSLILWVITRNDVRSVRPIAVLLAGIGWLPWLPTGFMWAAIPRRQSTLFTAFRPTTAMWPETRQGQWSHSGVRLCYPFRFDFGASFKRDNQRILASLNNPVRWCVDRLYWYALDLQGSTELDFGYGRPFCCASRLISARWFQWTRSLGISLFSWESASEIQHASDHTLTWIPNLSL